MCTAVVLIGWPRGPPVPPVPRQLCAAEAVQGRPAGGQLAPLRYLPVAVALQTMIARCCHGSSQRGCKLELLR
jgi:hypothetical protein